MTSTFRGWVLRQKLNVIERRGWEVASAMDVQSLFFLLKKIGFAP